jgi:tetratricopeptide (TPR) repeat protein
MRWVAALLLLAAPARADFWTRTLQPDRARAARLVRDGNAQLSPALALGILQGLPAELADQQTYAIEAARVRFALAKQLDPSLRAARLALADALTLADDSAAARRSAIAELEQLRALDPLYEAEEVAFQLGVLQARDGDLREAQREYEHSLRMHSADSKQPTQLLDLAEVIMAQGDPERALALYERAVRESDPGGRVLALWGSAVAHDRMGERAAALETARRAIAAERVPFAALHRASVFFVPAHEREYYEALGNLALSEVEPAEAAPPELEALLRDPVLAKYRVRGKHTRVLWYRLRALAGFERFLAADGGSGPFAEDAREHIARLAREL